MRGTDDACVGRGRIYVDTMAAREESGDLAGPLARGVIRRDAIAGTLDDLCSRAVEGRRNADEITLFTAVGPALADLGAAAPASRAGCEPEGACSDAIDRKASTPVSIGRATWRERGCRIGTISVV